MHTSVYSTRNTKERINKILRTWEREDDIDDWFQMWFKNNYDITLNYNIITELSQLKDYIFKYELSNISFNNIKLSEDIHKYSYIKELIYEIDRHGDEHEPHQLIDEEKLTLLIDIFKDLITIITALTNELTNPTIFPNISERLSGNNEYGDIQLFRTWRNIKQLHNVKNALINKGNDILTTENYLSTSSEKDKSLQFYFDASADNDNTHFTLWQINIPANTYFPDLYVTKNLSEVLLHMGSQLQLISSNLVFTDHTNNRGGQYQYTLEIYKYIGFCKNTINRVLTQYNKMLNILNSDKKYSKSILNKKLRITVNNIIKKIRKNIKNRKIKYKK